MYKGRRVRRRMNGSRGPECAVHVVTGSFLPTQEVLEVRARRDASQEGGVALRNSQSCIIFEHGGSRTALRAAAPPSARPADHPVREPPSPPRPPPVVGLNHMSDAERLSRLRHDLSNPLSALLAETQLLLMNESQIDRETVTGLKEIEALAIRMRTMLREP
jgi:signal transduction histidine kinase